MYEVFIKFAQKIVDINNFIFAPTDNFLLALNLPSWALSAIIDALHMVPFLFFIFIVIECFEYFYTDKINFLTKKSRLCAPFAGSILASMPQCGFSVIASTLYSKRLITKGTLLAVFLSTSDEAIPVLLAYPEKMHLVVHVILAKIIIAIIAGYGLDFLFYKFKKQTTTDNLSDIEDQGCCHHDLNSKSKFQLISHPIYHTLNVFVFILIITLLINFFFSSALGVQNIEKVLLKGNVLQPVFAAFLGLIPNCSVSIAFSLLYIKGAITFGSLISGLCSGAGLGLLVLIKRNKNFKDTLNIIFLLWLISCMAGIIIQSVIK